MDDFLELIQTIGAIIAAFWLWRQFSQRDKHHTLDRLIAWKSSTQQINSLILQDPAAFRPVLYPTMTTDEEVKSITAAYASLHTLEVIYMSRKKPEIKVFPWTRDANKILSEFVESYVLAGDKSKSESGNQFRKLWEQDVYRQAFGPEFRDELTRIFAKPIKQ